MHVLVIGGYGLIGLEVARALIAAGHTVTGLARSAGHGRRVLETANWIAADLNDLTTLEAWRPHLTGVDAVVNAAGALQSGGRDSLRLSQRDAIIALARACETAGISKFIQISAPGADPRAATEFLRTKGEADAALTAGPLDWVILQPGMVIAPTAYGGTSLLRMLAGFPLVQPVVLGDAPVQTVHVRDVAGAVVRCLDDSALTCREFDLVEDKPHRLEDVVLTFRRWLGFGGAPLLRLPALAGTAVSWLADIAGLLGWRAPLRSTAMTVLRDGVTGNPEPWRETTGQSLSSLDDTLASLPATRQERFYSRVQLLFPLLVVTLSLFWLASGLIGLWQRGAAAGLIAPIIGAGPAHASVYAGVAADLAIGVGIVVRKTCRLACFGAITVSAGYLMLGTWLTPHLWADPLGVLVKVFPGMALALAVAAMAGER